MHLMSDLDKLDLKLRLSMNPGTKLSELSRKFGIRSDVGLFLCRDSADITLFFPNNVDQHRDLKIFLKEFDAVEHMGVWRMRRVVERSTKFVELIRSLLSIPSVILSSFWLSEGIYTIEFIFHNADVGNVSKVLLEQMQNIENASIEYMGPSGTFASIALNIDAKTPLSVVEIGLTPPEEEMGVKRNPMGDSWERIVKMPYGSEKVEAIYFTSGKPADMSCTTEIEKNSIYEAVTENPYMSYMNRELNSRRILTLGRIHEYHKPDFTIYVMIPALLVNEFFLVVASSARDMKEWKPVIRGIVGAKEWVQSKISMKRQRQ